jgi:zinc finger protein
MGKANVDKRPANDGKRPTNGGELDFETVSGETCPFCNEKTLSLTEARREVPFFGMCLLFSMDCSNCKYHKADVETEETHEPARYTFECSSEEDLKVRVVKSANATVKIGTIGSIEPGEAANGYVTNIEGVLSRMKNQIEHMKRAAEEGEDEDEETIEQAKKHLKKLTRVLWGQEAIKITISDPTGNSAIISEKAEKKRL